MKKLTEIIIRFPWLFIAVLLAITLFFAYQIPNVRIDNELTTFLPEENPAKQFYNDAEETFGSGIIAVIGVFVEQNSGFEDVFFPSILTMIRDMSDELDELMITAPLAYREKVEDGKGAKLWKIIKKEEGEMGPEKVISLGTMAHLTSYALPAKEPGQEPEEMIEPLDMLPDPPGSRQERLDALAKGISYKSLPSNLLYSKSDVEKAKSYIRSWDLYKNNIVSENLKGTAIYVTIPREATIEYETKLHKFVMDIVKKYDRPDDGIVFHVSGLPMVAVLLGQYMHKDLATLVPICFVVMVFVLVLSFRRFNGVFMPFLTVLLAVIWTVGLMALLGKAMTVISSGLPVLLVAVGSAYTIHVIHNFYERAAAGTPKKEAIVSTMTKIGAAVLMAGLTTVGGFGSLASSNVIPIKEFGLFAAFGAFAALTINFFLVPAMLSIQPYKKGAGNNKEGDADSEFANAEKSLLGRSLKNLSSLVANHYHGVLLVSLLVFIGFAYATTRVIVNSDMVKYFREDSQIRVSDNFLNSILGGTTTFAVIIDSKKEEGFLIPENLRKIEDFQKFMNGVFPELIKKSMSLADYIKKVNMTLEKESPCEYRIPCTVGAVSENLMMYESKPEVLESVLDFDRRTVRVIMRATDGGTINMDRIKPVVENYVKHFMPDFDVKITGELYLRWVTDQKITQGQKRSIIISIIAVFILLLIIFRSFKLGFICLGPIVLSILGNFTIMAIVKYPLDVGTALIASTAVGIGIDYSIHYVNRYRIERARGADMAQAISRTHVTSGKAIIFNCVAVALGFLVLTGSQFIPLIRMGALTAAVMVLAAVSTLTTLPALLLLIKPYEKDVKE